MSTETVESKQIAALKRRVRQFYEHLNRGEFSRCYQAIDPAVREDAGSVTLHQYTQSLQRFLAEWGKVAALEMSFELYLNRSSKLYANRDFAVGETIWTDAAGERHTFQERWVRDGRSWYTRSTGFLAPS